MTGPVRKAARDAKAGARKTPARPRRAESVRRISGAERLPLDLGTLDAFIGFHVRLTAVAIYRDFARATADLGVTQTQFAILELVLCNTGVSQVDIAGVLAMDKATMMPLVDRLEKAGLLIRRISKIDRRRQELFLTAKGGGMLSTMHARVSELQRALCADLSQTEIRRLIATLGKIYRPALN